MAIQLDVFWILPQFLKRCIRIWKNRNYKENWNLLPKLELRWCHVKKQTNKMEIAPILSIQICRTIFVLKLIEKPFNMHLTKPLLIVQEDMILLGKKWYLDLIWDHIKLTLTGFGTHWDLKNHFYQMVRKLFRWELLLTRNLPIIGCK